MKTKLILVMVVILLKSVAINSQEKVIFFDSSEVYNNLLSEVKTNANGQLTVKMKKDGIRFLMYLDKSSSPIVSSYNQTYIITDSIRLVSKGGVNIKIFKNIFNPHYWSVEKRERTPISKELKKYEGGFKFENGHILKSLMKEEFDIIPKN